MDREKTYNEALELFADYSKEDVIESYVDLFLERNELVKRCKELKRERDYFISRFNNISSKPKKKKKGSDTKAKGQKAVRGLENTLTRKEQYHQQLEHPLWAEKRSMILKRDQYQCRLCGSKHNLQVHHIKYSSGKKAWEYPNIDLITLCEDCHQKVHADKNHDLNPYREK